LLDINWIRENQDAFVKGLTNRGFEAPGNTLNQFLSLDEQRRTTIRELQEAQARRNAASKEIGQAKASKDDASAKRLMDEVAVLKSTIQGGEAAEKRLDDELRALLAGIPNTPADDVPVGPDEKANVELRKVGTPPKFSFQSKQHFELGEALGLMDFETAARLSGSRFVVLKGALARLERALAQFMLDLHTTEHGYTEVNPPLLVRDDTMFGTAQLPKFADDQFATARPVDIADAAEKLAREYPSARTTFEPTLAKKIIEKLLTEGMATDDPLFEGKSGPERVAFTDYIWRNLHEIWKDIKARRVGLWLIPTAEVPLTNLVREDITDEAKLPIRVTASTPCFRAEAGAAGKDTRGMIRQHQFSKVELVSITTPEQSKGEHERMTACAEEVLKRLGVPYRVVVLSTGDMGFASQKTYDIEVWLPGQGAYREISSCSNCGDFQARRMNARYRPVNAKETRYVHTLNGSGVAVGRALIAVMENYQETDGSIRIPDALKPYMGGLERIAAKS
jgi:seryl-tRNA synthetase